MFSGHGAIDLFSQRADHRIVFARSALLHLLHFWDSKREERQNICSLSIYLDKSFPCWTVEMWSKNSRKRMRTNKRMVNQRSCVYKTHVQTECIRKQNARVNKAHSYAKRKCKQCILSLPAQLIRFYKFMSFSFQVLSQPSIQPRFTRSNSG